jgi:hypothetical protein
MNNGQRLHVEFGRVELRLGPGAGITMTSGSTLHMAENRLSDVQLELEEGSALVKVDQLFKGGRLRVMFPDGAVELRTIGWYRFDAKSHTMRVYRGEAEVALGDSVVKAKKGQAVVVAGLPAVSSFNLKESDALVDQELARNREIEKGQRRLREQAALQRARRAIGIAERREANQRQSPQPPTLAQAAGNQ